MAEPIFRGETIVEQKPIRRWVRGKGWETIFRWRGKDLGGYINAVAGKGATEITTVPENDGVYESLEITIPAFNYHDPGGILEPANASWELDHNVEEASIFSHPDVLAIEEQVPGFIGIIKAAAREYETGEIRQLSDYGQAEGSSSDIDYLRVQGVLANAEELFLLLINDHATFRIYQPIIQLTQSIPERGLAFGNGIRYPNGQVGATPKIYSTTATCIAFLRSLSLSATFPFAAMMPEGVWLETPPRGRTAAEGRYDVTQQWEWYSSISALLYPNRI